MTLSKDTHNLCKRVARKLFDNKVEHLFVLGKGAAMPIALEGIYLLISQLVSHF